MNSLIKQSGQVFTPDYLVNLILDEAGYNGEQILQRHCIDNSCGDGAFLCEIIRRYITAYQSKHKTLAGVETELRTFIHGIELESVAYDCCLANVASVLDSFHLSDTSIDLLHANTLTVHDFDNKMDYVIGNPPYVRVHNLEDNFETVKSYSFANGGMTDLYLVFFEIGLNMLEKGGKLCYITPSSWINSVAGANLRTYILANRNLVSLIDLGHYQAFKSTTYTLISLFEKGASNTSFTLSDFNPDTLGKSLVCDIPFSKANINGYFYLADNDTLTNLRQIFTSHTPRYVSVKNGFATLADKIFISSDFSFDKFVIPIIKASTGKWYKALFPYDKDAKPVSKEILFENRDIADYLEANKTGLQKRSSQPRNQFWYLYGRSQALKDVYTDKFSINTIIKDIQSLKLNRVPSGCGIYSGLYILTEASYETLSAILLSDDFVKYIASLKKYKSGGYYTYNSKELELFLNFKLFKLINEGKVSIKQIN